MTDTYTIKSLGKYYEICREERNYVALLYHHLLSDPKNLEKFTNESLGLKNSNLDYKNAQIYFEFAFLRDLWRSFKRNEEKQELIKDFMGDDFLEQKIFTLLPKHTFKSPTTTSPSRWKINCQKVKDTKGKLEPELFLKACLLKWAFNIKPDLVIIFHEKETKINKIICIEAKIESGVGQYPLKDKKCLYEKLKTCKSRYKDYLTNTKEKSYVTQTKLQEFMFKEILKQDDVSFFLIQKKESKTLPPFNAITWEKAFNATKEDAPDNADEQQASNDSFFDKWVKCALGNSDDSGDTILH